MKLDKCRSCQESCYGLTLHSLGIASLTDGQKVNFLIRNKNKTYLCFKIIIYALPTETAAGTSKSTWEQTRGLRTYQEGDRTADSVRRDGPSCAVAARDWARESQLLHRCHQVRSKTFICVLRCTDSIMKVSLYFFFIFLLSFSLYSFLLLCFFLSFVFFLSICLFFLSSYILPCLVDV